MNRLSLFFLMLPTFVFSQTYIGDFQVDKTYNGSIVKGHDKVTISFVDPKPSTNINDEFKNLPRGSLVIKAEELEEPIKYTMVYAKPISGGDLYIITSTHDLYNLLCVMRRSHTEGNKIYNYSFRTGRVDPSTMAEPLLLYTDYYCNKTQADQK